LLTSEKTRRDVIRADEIKVKKEDWRRHQMCVIRQHCCMALTYWQR
jgi:hypothetical protein